MIQDIYPHRFHNEYQSAACPDPDSPVLVFRGRSVLAGKTEWDGRPALIFPEARNFKDDPAARLIYAFAVDDTAYYLYLPEDPADRRTCPAAGDEASAPVPGISGCQYTDILESRLWVSNVEGMILFTGFHLYQWYRDSRFCGACGSRTAHDAAERAMICPACGKKIYPRLFPAVIVGVLDGDKLLVTKYKEGFNHYALIAGFAEIGETLEETVAREVMEETGLRVKNIRYYKSQPWGVVEDLLAGFYCDVDGDTQIRLDGNELKLAEWKQADGIVLQPDSFSLTNEMMKRFKDGLVAGTED